MSIENKKIVNSPPAIKKWNSNETFKTETIKSRISYENCNVKYNDYGYIISFHRKEKLREIT